jgi:D-glycero-D-manno-heptose 1,7-bisphosphate phosphatase
LLYSDNFVQFNILRLQRQHQKHNAPITLLLAAKEKGNIRVSADGRVEAYDKTRSGSGFDYVEVGYMLIERNPVLEDFPTYAEFPDFNFSEILQKYALQAKIAGLVVDDSYHSISDPVRLQLMCEYLKPKRILLIDRDGTINKKASQGEYIANWSGFEWIPETLQAMKDLAKEGFKFIVITNQAGIARKMINAEDLETIHKKMVEALAAEGVNILKIYVSPHHWNDNSFMRKPSPGMFFQAAKEYNLRMDRCLYVGDDERDCEAAVNAGCGMVYVSNDNKLSPLADYSTPFIMVKNLQVSVEKIKEIYIDWEAIS